MGSVVSDVGGIDTANALNFAEFKNGTLVTLSATPNAGSAFVSWSVPACGANLSCTVTMMDQIQSVTAYFELDIDGDGVPDGLDVCNGNDVSGDTDSDQTCNDLDTDDDGDGLPDAWEITYTLDPLDATGINGAVSDPDADGLNNTGEFAAGTDPRNPDTDGDTLLDGVDPAPLVADALAPTGIVVPATSTGNQVAISWSASTTPGATYFVEEWQDNGDGIFNSSSDTRKTAPSALTGTSYVFTNDVQGGVFFYRVKTVAAGYTESGWVVGGNGCTIVLQAAPPSNFVVPTSSTTGDFTLSWAASAEAQGYEIEESTDGNFIGNPTYTIGNVTSYGVVGKDSGITYYYKIRATRYVQPSSDWVAGSNACKVAYLVVTSPNGGETLTGGTAATVTWAPHDGADNYKLYWSPDGDAGPWATIASVGDVTSYDWNVPETSTTRARFRISAFNGTQWLSLDISDADFTVELLIPPSSLAVTSPNGSETLTSGTTATVTWDAQDGADNYILYWSPTGAGGPWAAVATVGNVTNYNWTVPATSATTARFRISAFSGTQWLKLDISDADFTVFVASPPSVLTVTSPNGGETLIGGTSATVTWDAQDGADNYKLYWAPAGAAGPWALIASVGNVTSYNWTVPVTDTTTARFRISAFNGAQWLKLDISNADFTILTPSSLALTSPNGGEILTGGSTETVTWGAQNGADNYILYWSPTGAGGPWAAVAAVGNVTNYNWTVPVTNTTAGRFRISAFKGTQWLKLDISDADFTILSTPPANLVITSPNGGETLTGGSTATVTWNAQNGADNYKLYWSPAGANGPWAIIASVGNTISYSWDVPAENTTTGRFRISAFKGTQWLKLDISDADFNIVSP
jgi:hypothetical protein